MGIHNAADNCLVNKTLCYCLGFFFVALCVGVGVGVWMMEKPHSGTKTTPAPPPNTTTHKGTVYLSHAHQAGSGRWPTPPPSRTDSDVTCDDGWVEFAGRCYLFQACPSMCSPEYAERECERIHAILSPVRSQEHNEFVLSKYPRKEVYIGGSDRNNEGVWTWGDNTTISDGYSNFGFQAGYFGGWRFDCLRIDYRDRKWYDERCDRNDHNMAYVCERNATRGAGGTM